MTIFLRRGPSRVAKRRRRGVHLYIISLLQSTHPNPLRPRQFWVTFVISLMKTMEIHSESAVKLLAEFQSGVEMLEGV
jgi:hypothetical protein